MSRSSGSSQGLPQGLDTRPSEEVVERATGADLLIHDCTFGDEGADRARETFHSTAREAAEIAARAGAKRLCLTHLSARYSANSEPLEREAREVHLQLPDTLQGFVSRGLNHSPLLEMARNN